MCYIYITHYNYYKKKICMLKPNELSNRLSDI